MTDHHTLPEKPQLTYAGVLRWSTTIAFILVAISFGVLVVGILPAYVPIELMTAHWHMSAHEYTETLNIPVRWTWIGHLSSGDMLSYAAVGLLALSAVPSLIAAFFSFANQKSYWFAAIVLLQLVVLALAAGGVFEGP